MRPIFPVALLLALGLQSSGGQMPAQPIEIAPSGSRVLGVPAFSFTSDPVCDRDGNMYFHVGDPSRVAILRLSPQGSESTLFKLAGQLDDADKVMYGDFSVTPGGVVYVLGGIEGTGKIFRFDTEGKMEDAVSLGVPPGVIGSNLVASDAGTILLFGFYDDTAPANLRGKGYLALLDRSGKVRNELKAGLPGVDMARLINGEALAPGISLADDGNYYFAGSNALLVISQEGEVVRRIPFDNPDPKSSVTGVRVSGGAAAIQLTRADGLKVHQTYLVLETSGGGVVGYYQLSKEAGGLSAVCYSAKRGLTFLKLENGQVKLLTAPLP